MELLICTTDTGLRCKPGDVIDARPDGWAWSQVERDMLGWEIVTVDLTQIEAVALIEGFTKISVADLPQVLTRADLYAKVLA